MTDRPPDPAPSRPPPLRLGDLRPAFQVALQRFSVGGLIPILIFYVLLKLSGPGAGILGGTTASLIALGMRFRQVGRVDPVVVVPMVIILIQGALALAFNSVELYLAAPAIENAMWGVVLLVSVAIGRPLVLSVVLELNLVPPAYQGAPPIRRALRLVTILWALGAFVKSGVRLWLLSFLPLEMFLLGVSAFHTVLNAGLLSFAVWWTLRSVRRWADGQPDAAETGSTPAARV